MQERILWALAAAAIAILFGSAFWPHFAAEAPVPQTAPKKSPAAPLANPIRVEILNGCGVTQVAARLRNKARALGLDVIHEGNAPSFDYLHTLVIDLSGDLKRARQVAEVLGIPHLIQQKLEDPFRLADVSIGIGRDFSRIGLFEVAERPQ